MNIGINCLSIKPKYIGGVTTFTFGIIDGLIIQNNQNIYQLYVNKNNKHLFHKYNNKSNVELILCKHYSYLKYIISNIALLIFNKNLFKKLNHFLFKDLESYMDNKSDLVYTPSPTLLSLGNKKPTLVSMHDIQHLHFPEYFNFLTLKHRKKNYLYTAQSANYLQASSDFIKYDFLKNYPFLNKDKIFTIREGVKSEDFQINKSKIEKCRIKYKLPNEFIFCPAQLWHHKDHGTILESLKILKEEKNLKINLILSGEKFSASKPIFNTIDKFSLNKQVFYLGKVPFDDLVALYYLSKYFITATLYESSSLPALEAATVGTGIIASDTPPNREMNEVLQLNLFKAKDSISLSEIINNIWNDNNLRNKQLRHNMKYVKEYTWEKIGVKYNNCFESIINITKNVQKIN